MNFEFSLKWLANLDLKEVPPEALCAIECAVAEEKRRRSDGRGANLYRRRDEDKRRLGRTFGHTVIRDETEEALEAAMVSHFLATVGSDWSSYFPAPDGDPEYYVYLHYDPRAKRRIRLSSGSCVIAVDGEPFYVGKGTGLRAYDLKRNDGHGVILRQLRQCGFMAEDVVKVVASGLRESEALELESKLVHFFGSRYDPSNPGVLVNLAATAGPTLRPRRPALVR